MVQLEGGTRQLLKFEVDYAVASVYVGETLCVTAAAGKRYVVERVRVSESEGVVSYRFVGIPNQEVKYCNTVNTEV